jgi:hypothetical protein
MCQNATSRWGPPVRRHASAGGTARGGAPRRGARLCYGALEPRFQGPPTMAFINAPAAGHATAWVGRATGRHAWGPRPYGEPEAAAVLHGRGLGRQWQCGATTPACDAYKRIGRQGAVRTAAGVRRRAAPRAMVLDFNDCRQRRQPSPQVYCAGSLGARMIYSMPACNDYGGVCPHPPRHRNRIGQCLLGLPSVVAALQPPSHNSQLAPLLLPWFARPPLLTDVVQPIGWRPPERSSSSMSGQPQEAERTAPRGLRSTSQRLMTTAPLLLLQERAGQRGQPGLMCSSHT